MREPNAAGGPPASPKPFSETTIAAAPRSLCHSSMASPPPPSSSSPPPPSKKLKMSSTAGSDDDEEEEECRNGAGEAPPLPLSSSAGGEPKRRYKRRKVAIFLAYCGAGYQGMQKNPGARTIEGDLEEALFHCGAVPEPDRGKPRRYDWARAARTDKGVSAAGQVVSGRFYVDPPGFVDRLNDNLSPQIRAFGYRRVTASFNAKKFCDRRRYVYLLPVLALDPNAHPNRESVMASLGSENELAKCLECSERGRKVAGLVGRQGVKTCGEEQRTHHGTEESEIVANSESPKVEGSVGHGQGTEGGISVVEEEKGGEITNGSEEEKLALSLGDLGAGEANATAPARGESESKVPSEVFTTGGAAEAGNVDSESRPDLPVSEEDVEAKAMLTSEELEPKPGEEPTIEAGASKAEEATPGTPQMSRGNGEHAPGRAGEFRYGEKERARFNAILGRYVGTHNFHNFTTRTKAEDPSARRYIVSFDARAVMDIGGIEFIRCEVVGQSFMLHQIRKMVGLAVSIMRNCTPESMMDTALRKDVNINVPTAPEVGLYLDECLFTSYNQKWKDSHEAVSMAAYAEQAEEFRAKHIFSHIAAMEHKEGAVALWLHSLNHRNYPDFRLAEARCDGGGCNAAEGAQAEEGAADAEMS